MNATAFPGASTSITVASSRSQPVPNVFIPNISLNDNQVFLKFMRSPNNGTQWDIEIEFDESSKSYENEFCIAFPHARAKEATKLDIKVSERFLMTFSVDFTVNERCRRINVIVVFSCREAQTPACSHEYICKAETRQCSAPRDLYRDLTKDQINTISRQMPRSQCSTSAQRAHMTSSVRGYYIVSSYLLPISSTFFNIYIYIFQKSLSRISQLYTQTSQNDGER